VEEGDQIPRRQVLAVMPVRAAGSGWVSVAGRGYNGLVMAFPSLPGLAVRLVTWVVAGRPKRSVRRSSALCPRQLLGLRLPTSAWCRQGFVPAMYSTRVWT
jgi:hypothetical protein